MKRVFEIAEIMPGVTILDCNGRPLEPDKHEYCNRFQSSLSHTITSIHLKAKVLKTCGGHEHVKPFAYCTIRYYDKRSNRKTRDCQFESLYVEKGMYVFPQLIPCGEEMAFDYEWCNDWSYIENLKKHIGLAEIEEVREKERAAYIADARLFFDLVFNEVCNIGHENFGEKFTDDTVKEVIALGFKKKYDTDWHSETDDSSKKEN